jgi:hypothetical protein
VAIAFVSKGAFTSAAATIAPTLPSGMAAGHLMLLFVNCANRTPPTPTGWTLVTNTGTGTAGAAGATNIYVFRRFWVSGDTAPSITVTSDYIAGIILGYSGVDPTTPLDATPTTSIQATASTTITAPTITTVTANAVIVMAAGLDLDATSTTATSGTPTNAALTGIAIRHVGQTVLTGTGGGLTVYEGTKAAAGATGTTAYTCTSTIKVNATVALRPFIQTPVGPISGFVEDFEGQSSLNAAKLLFFNDYEGSAESTNPTPASMDVTGGKCRLIPVDPAGFNSDGRIRSFDIWTMPDGDAGIYAKIDLPAAMDLTNTEISFVVYKAADGSSNTGNFFGFSLSENVFHTAIIFDAGAFEASNDGNTYDRTSCAWWGIRRNGVNLECRVAPDSGGSPGTWTTIATYAVASISWWDGNVRFKIHRRNITSIGVTDASTDNYVSIAAINTGGSVASLPDPLFMLANLF